ncbi:MAG TPA: CARDB domain-containing protein, partial [Verrucomicrobiae bacterium]
TLARTLLPEGSNTFATVTRNTPTTNDLVVTLTSSDPTEAAVPASVTIPAGSNTATFTVAAVNDGTPDGTQPATLTASASGFNSGVAVLQVTDINLPDLQLTEVSGAASGFTKAMASLSFRVANFGLAPLTNAIVQRVWLSNDALPGGDTLVGEFTFNQGNESIAPGLSFQQSVTTFLPLQPGDYWVIVTADAANAAVEVDEANNTRVSSAPIRVVADYSATVQTAVTTATAGTVVPMTGLVTMANGQSPEGKLVNIHITKGGFRRVIGALAQADGSFTVNFRPLPNEAGIYTIGAAHPGETTAPVQDTFTLLGAKFDPASPALTLAPDASLGGTATLQNLGDAPLTGLAVSPINAPANLNVTAMLATNTLPADGSVALSYGIAVTAETPSPADFTLRVTSAEGVATDLPVSVTIRALQAQLVAKPASLTAGMVVGGQRLVAFDVVNQGGATSGPVQIVLPQVAWLAVAGPNPLPPLAPGETNSVTLQLTPPADLPLTAYDGQVAVLGGASAVPVPFRFIALSEARGSLEVFVEDENTYYTAGQPRVAGATVRLLDPFSRTVVAETLTDTNGTALFLGLTEGPYTLQAEAPQHDTYSSPVTVEAGLTNSVRAFIAVQTVAYRWSVVPTEVADRYRMTLETTFEANVPWPVVTVDQPLIVPLVFPGEVTQTEITLTNHGLLAAQGVVLNVRDTATYKITPLIRDIGELPARSSITIPVLIQLQPDADQRAVAAIRAHTGGGS